MTKIRIVIPEKKIPYYMGANAASTAMQTGGTAAMAAAKTAVYKTVMLPKYTLNSDEDKLRLTGRLTPEYDNELVLKANDGTIIHLVGCEIDVTQKNNIVETALVGRAGKVKERIQQEDYTVNVHAKLFGPLEAFPHEDLKLLVKILSSQSSIACSAVYLDLFGITKLVFKTAQFNQKQLKHFNVLPVELTFVSDEDYGFLVEE